MNLSTAPDGADALVALFYGPLMNRDGGHDGYEENRRGGDGWPSNFSAHVHALGTCTLST
jgi:hypothetical protein